MRQAVADHDIPRLTEQQIESLSGSSNSSLIMELVKVSTTPDTVGEFLYKDRMAEIKRVGKAPIGPQAKWTTWIHPNEVAIDALPSNVSIVYEIGSSEHGTLPGPEEDIAESIIYVGEGKRTIGESEGGRDIGRIKDLVRSWTERLRNGPHESYRNWEDMEPHIQPSYDSIRIRYKPVAEWNPLSWTKDVTPLRGVDDVAGRELAHLKEQQNRRDRSSNDELAKAGTSLRPQTDYPYDEERRLLRSFQKRFDRLPFLNGNAGDDDGPLADDDWMNNHLANLQNRRI